MKAASLLGFLGWRCGCSRGMDFLGELSRTWAPLSWTPLAPQSLRGRGRVGEDARPGPRVGWPCGPRTGPDCRSCLHNAPISSGKLLVRPPQLHGLRVHQLWEDLGVCEREACKPAGSGSGVCMGAPATSPGSPWLTDPRQGLAGRSVHQSTRGRRSSPVAPPPGALNRKAAASVWKPLGACWALQPG